MFSQPHRPLIGLAAVCAAMTVTACAGFGDSDPTETGPPRLTPEPRPDVAAAMVDEVLQPQERLDTCGLLGLTTSEIIELTEAEMPLVEPTGLDELGMPCTFGGPGAPERLQTALEDEAEEEAEAGTAANGTPANATTTVEATTAAEPDDELPVEPDDEPPLLIGPTAPADSELEAPELDPLPPEEIPISDTVSAGVVKPRSGALEALAGQPVMLGSRYACSEVRGPDAEAVPGELSGVPEAPAPVNPELASQYIDCIAAPTGGGVEVHTIFVADNDLWHLTFIRPGTPRSPEADAEALEGLHRVAAQVLA